MWKQRVMRLTKKDKEENLKQQETPETDANQEEMETESVSEGKDEEASKEQEELMSRLVRLQADFDNYKKRTVKEKEDIYKYALEGFSLKILPVLDNLERAIQSLDEKDIQDEYTNGVRMVLNQLLEVMEKEGLAEIICEGATFDPNLHYGVTTEDSEEHEEDQVMEVFQKGYKFKEKVIRPAMVKICRKQ